MNDLREERFILVHSFTGFSPWSTGSGTTTFRPVTKQKHYGREGVEKKTCLPPDNQETEREGKRPGIRCITQNYTLSNPLPLMRLCPNFSFSYDLIDELIY
jgi:hypothetical protein